MVRSTQVELPPCGKPFWESKSLWVFVAQEIAILAAFVAGELDEKTFLVATLTLLSASIMRVMTKEPLRIK